MLYSFPQRDYALGKEEAYIVFFIIFFILAIAVCCDFKTFRIPNRLNYAGWIIGILYSSVTEGIRGMVSSIIWVLIPILALFVFFIFNILGSGDIKLFSFIGSLIFSKVVFVIAFSMIAAAVYGLALILYSLAKSIRIGKPELHLTTAHFSVFILIGVLAYWTGGMIIGI